MSDDASNDDVKDPADAGDDQKVTIGDVEMTADEAKDLIESGKSFRELREKYPDIDWKEMPAEFTKRSQELAEFKKPKKEPENLEPDEEKRRKQIDDFFADPYVQEKLSSKQKEKEDQLREDLEFNKVIENLEAEFDGSDGRPKFVKKDVLEYGMKNQLFNPRTAYKEMHEQELDEWKLKQTLEKKRPTTFFEKRGGTGAKQPDVKTPKTFREATEAALAAEE